MRSVVFAAIVIIVLLAAGLFSGTPQRTAAENGAMATPAGGTPTPVCTPIEIDRGNLVGFMPSGMLEGVVSLPVQPGEFDPPQSLFLTVLRMPPASCMDFRFRLGAVVLFVQEGSIEYTAHATNLAPSPLIKMGDSGGIDGDTVDVPLDTPTTLHATDWLTQDRIVWFSFRNAGSTDAVVSVALYVVPWDDDTCGGGCRKP